MVLPLNSQMRSIGLSPSNNWQETAALIPSRSTAFINWNGIILGGTVNTNLQNLDAASYSRIKCSTDVRFTENYSSEIIPEYSPTTRNCKSRDEISFPRPFAVQVRIPSSPFWICSRIRVPFGYTRCILVTGSGLPPSLFSNCCYRHVCRFRLKFSSRHTFLPCDAFNRISRYRALNLQTSTSHSFNWRYRTYEWHTCWIL